MKVWIGDRAYLVSWRYDVVRNQTIVDNERVEGSNFFVQKGGGCRPYPTVLTTCFIRESGQRNDIGIGEAQNDARYDKHEKEIGRKHSLTKALKNAGFTRDERREFWLTYWERGL